MAKYLLAFLLLAAVGTAIIIVGYPAITGPACDINVTEMKVVTESSQESSAKEPEISTRASFAWTGSYKGDRLYVEKKAGNDYYIVKTFDDLSPEMSYREQGGLTPGGNLNPGEKITYRLVLMNKGKPALAEHQPLQFNVPLPITFNITDTILPEDDKISLSWERIDGFDNYKAAILADDGSKLASKEFEGSETPLVWILSADKFDIEKTYTLTVSTEVEQSSCLQESKSSRVFRIGQLEEAEDEENE